MVIFPSMFLFGLFSRSDGESSYSYLPPEQLALDVPNNLPMLDANAPIGLNKGDEKQYFGEITSGGKAVMPYTNEPVNLQFCFKNYLKSLQGYWSSMGSGIVLDGALKGNVQGTSAVKKSSWGSSVKDNEVSIEPCFDIVLPINEIPIDAHLDQRVIEIQVGMAVKFPSPRYDTVNNNPIKGYVNKTKNLSHSSEIYVLTTEEIKQYQALKEQSHSDARERQRKGTWLFVIGVILIGTFVILLIKLISKKTGIRVNWIYWFPDDIRKWLHKRRQMRKNS
jgi:hypothetical protein